MVVRMVEKKNTMVVNFGQAAQLYREFGVKRSLACTPLSAPASPSFWPLR